MLAGITVGLGLTAAVVAVLLVVPGEYARLTTAGEFVHLLTLVGPYLVLALLAWRHRQHGRVSRALLVLTVVLALVGLSLLRAESSHYRSEVRAFAARDPARGAGYLQKRFPRTMLFLVPALQWPVTLLAAAAVSLQAGRGRPESERT